MAVVRPHENFHGARRLDQLLLHHVLSILLISCFLYVDMPLSLLSRYLLLTALLTLLRYLLLLEISGGLSCLVNVITLTPLSGTRIQWWITVICFLELVYHRIWEWAEVGYISMVWWFQECSYLGGELIL